MKKDDKQPDKPKKKPLKKAASKLSANKKPKQQDDKPIEITLPAKSKPNNPTPAHVFKERRLNLDAKKYRDSLSVDEWLELSKKDPDLLTPTQAKQLAEANKQASEIAKRITELYDFKGIAAMFKTIDTVPIARVMQQAQETALVLNKFQTNLILPTLPVQQLVSFQQNLAISTGIINQSFVSAINASNILHNFFSDWQIIHERLIKALSIDIGSLANSLSRITPTQFIDVDVIDVIDRDGNVAIITDTNQTQRINDDFIYVSSAKVDLLFTEIRANRKEISELKQLITGQLPSGMSKIAYADVRFIFERSKMVIKGIEVFVSRTSQQARFCDFFFSSRDNFVKKWDIVEFMAAAFDEHKGIDDEAAFVSRIKGIVNALNDKITIASKGQITQFFVLLSYEVYINPEHISNL
jgi:hypothetical protein